MVGSSAIEDKTSINDKRSFDTLFTSDQLQIHLLVWTDVVVATLINKYPNILDITWETPYISNLHTHDMWVEFSTQFSLFNFLNLLNGLPESKHGQDVGNG